MADQNQRSTTLRRYQAELKKVADEAQAAFTKAEDALFVMQDREARRSTRSTADQQKLDALRNRM